jgi:hypothetical protein
VSNVAAYLAAAVLLGTPIYRLATDRRTAPHSTRRYGYGLLTSLAFAMAMLAPATPRALARLGVDQSTEIMLGESIRTAAVSLLMFMAYSVDRRRVRGIPIFAAALAQLVMAALFVTAGPIVVGDMVSVAGTGRWLLAARDLAFAAYTAWSLATALTALGGEARRVGAGPLRIGIRCTLTACHVGFVWTAWIIDDVVNVLRSGTQDGSEDLVSNLLGALCALFIVLGLLVMKWHGLFATAQARARSYLMYRRITPLWEALHAEFPQIALDIDRRRLPGARLFVFDVDYLLYRRIVEIHDGRLALRPHAPERAEVAEVAEVADDLDGAASIEAASIAIALANRQAGRVTAAATAEGAGYGHPGIAGTVEAEARWLARVSAEFTALVPSSSFTD